MPVLALALAVVVIAGNSLRRTGRWSRRTYAPGIIATSVLCLVATALVFLPRPVQP